eukprot:g2593.t1
MDDAALAARLQAEFDAEADRERRDRQYAHQLASTSSSSSSSGVVEFRVPIPSGAAAGTVLQCRAPDGRLTHIKVPVGGFPGRMLLVSLPPFQPGGLYQPTVSLLPHAPVGVRVDVNNAARASGNRQLNRGATPRTAQLVQGDYTEEEALQRALQMSKRTSVTDASLRRSRFVQSQSQLAARLPGSSYVPSREGERSIALMVGDGIDKRSASRNSSLGELSVHAASGFDLFGAAHEVNIQGGGNRRPASLAPALVKRSGFRASVMSSDMTLCDPKEGTLEKKSSRGSWQTRFFWLNNSYMNYSDNHDDKVISGSYNLQRLSSVAHLQTDIILNFHGGMSKTLRAASWIEAKDWVEKIEDRRLWFTDVCCAQESRDKVQRLTQVEREKREREEKEAKKLRKEAEERRKEKEKEEQEAAEEANAWEDLLFDAPNEEPAQDIDLSAQINDNDAFGSGIGAIRRASKRSMTRRYKSQGFEPFEEFDFDESDGEDIVVPSPTSNLQEDVAKMGRRRENTVTRRKTIHKDAILSMDDKFSGLLKLNSSSNFKRSNRQSKLESKPSLSQLI